VENAKAMDELLVFGLVVALVAEMLYALWCANWMRKRYGRRLMRSAVWDRLVEGEVRTVIASVILMFVVIYGFWLYAFDITEPPIPRPLNSILLSIALFLLLYGPIADKRMVQRLEREGHNAGDPPQLTDQEV
jgi:hypothetical protein